MSLGTSNIALFSQIKFVIVDFEFTMINRKDLLLISGAISNSLGKYHPKKLNGKPLILTTENQLRFFGEENYNRLIYNIKRIFQRKPELLQPLLEKIKKNRTYTGEVTLCSGYLMRYLHEDRKLPIVVFWNGITDNTIMKRLRIQNIYKTLNITTYNDDGNNRFYLKLLDMDRGNSVLYREYIGDFTKNGRMLSLKEAHDSVCKIKHEITRQHDPVTNVVLTKCIFNFLVRKIKPLKLYRMCKPRNYRRENRL